MLSTNHHSSLLHEFMKDPPPHNVSARNGKKAHLCYINEAVNPNQEDQYWMIRNDGMLTVLGITGLVQTVSIIKNKEHSPPILCRANGYGNYKTKNTQHSMEHILDTTYKTISRMKFADPKDKDLFSWRAQRVIARFGDYKKLYSQNDIIPEYNDSMTIVKVGEGCPRHCTYCPEPTKTFKMYNLKQIKENMQLARKLQKRYHKGHLYLMNEGFLNSSDILWHHFSKKNIDPIMIADMFRNYFPEIQKMYAFMGVPNVNRASQTYLNSLVNVDRINRVLIGIESFDDMTSAFVKKEETVEEKIAAIKKLQQTGFKIKPIIQVGLPGKQFSYQGKMRRTKDRLKKTVDILCDIMRPISHKRPDKVLVSKHRLVEGTPLMRQVKYGNRIKPFKSEQELDKLVQWVIEELTSANIDCEADYEVALDGRKRARQA